MRVALYQRVSTEEQAKHGISIEAQDAALRKWAEVNEHEIVGVYIDNGVSARKMPSKRPALQKLLHDIPENKTELIAFTKLDRWTRNVKGYYQVQDILDRNKVAWIAVQEDYETITASGRFKVNIMLSVAENEADRTSERIKAVFEHKIEKGEFTGGRPPLGFMIEGKKLVPNPETIETARQMFRHYLDTASYYDTARYLHDKTGMMWEYHYLRRCLSNRLYVGEYRSNANYCEPIIERAVFDSVQALMKSRSVRHNQTSRMYLFSGIIRCECCGHAMTAFSLPKKHGQDYYYRCHEAALYHRCYHTHAIREERLERWLLDNVAEKLDEYTAQYTITAKQKPHDNAKIRRKLEKLKELYLNDLLSLEQYRKDRAELEAQILDETALPDFAQLREQFAGNFRSVYKGLTRKQKQLFWRSTIENITLDADNKPRISFREGI